MTDNAKVRGGMAALGFLALCGIAMYFYLGARTTLQPAAQAPAPVPAPAPAPPVPPPTPVPQFDVVRVDPSGNTVIAGRAAPGATVIIKGGNTVLGTVTADSDGAFAFAPDLPLPPGAEQLSLAEALPGGKIIAGPATASVDVPAKPDAAQPDAAQPDAAQPDAAQPDAAPLAVVSGPTGSKVVSGQGPKTGTLGIGTVDYDANGHAIFSGTAPAGDHVSLALGGANLGSAVAGPDGRWRLTAQVPRNSGTLNLADAVNKPVAAPFALETLQDAVADGNIVIAPGQNLWLIARHVYGHGNMYTLIYKANQTQIQDPNLIFPGQAFALPQPKG
jgi:nucleoid-associated protein YgaU